MPNKAKKIQRPWELTPINYKTPGQGRKFGGNQKFYKSPAWRQLRLIKLAQSPFCECDYCKKNNLIFAANVVDHIHPINPKDPYDTQDGKYGEPLDLNNLRSMCFQHHNRKSAKERHLK